MDNSVSPTTTVQEDLTFAGQRRVNLIWEVTQSLIALGITTAVVYTAFTQRPDEVLTNAFFLIIGFYFSRVNHNAIGGTGKKATDNQIYQGR